MLLVVAKPFISAMFFEVAIKVPMESRWKNSGKTCAEVREDILFIYYQLLVALKLSTKLEQNVLC